MPTEKRGTDAGAAHQTRRLGEGTYDLTRIVKRCFVTDARSACIGSLIRQVDCANADAFKIHRKDGRQKRTSSMFWPTTWAMATSVRAMPTAKSLRRTSIDSSREGMRFTDAHTNSSVCTPTRYGILTGRYCWRTEKKNGVLHGHSNHLIDPARRNPATH